MKRNHLQLLAYCFILWLLTFDFSVGKQKSAKGFFVKVVRVDSVCPHHEIVDGTLKFHYINITQSAFQKQYINVKFELKNPPPRPKKVKITISNCVTQNLDSCLEVISFRTDICEVLTGKGVYKMYFGNVTPKLTCPLKSGIHEVRNFTLDAGEVLAVIPASLKGIFENYLHIRFHILNNNNADMTCIDMLLKAEQIRKRVS